MAVRWNDDKQNPIIIKDFFYKQSFFRNKLILNCKHWEYTGMMI